MQKVEIRWGPNCLLSHWLILAFAMCSHTLCLKGLFFIVCIASREIHSMFYIWIWHSGLLQAKAAQGLNILYCFSLLKIEHGENLQCCLIIILSLCIWFFFTACLFNQIFGTCFNRLSFLVLRMQRLRKTVVLKTHTVQWRALERNDYNIKVVWVLFILVIFSPN